MLNALPQNMVTEPTTRTEGFVKKARKHHGHLSVLITETIVVAIFIMHYIYKMCARMHYFKVHSTQEYH